MRLIAQDGTSLILHPLRYQFAAGTGPADDRWLVIGGHLRVADRSWSFEDPCLRIDEAYELSAWLLRFVEPVLAFSLAARDEAGAVVRVHCSLEAAPPWLDEGRRLPWGQAVALRVPRLVLRQAATQWAYELDSLPPRVPGAGQAPP